MVKRKNDSTNQGSEKKPKKDVKVNKRLVQYRSNIHCAITEVDRLNLNVNQLAAIREYCPFWKMIKLIVKKKITLESTKKSDIEVKNLIEKFDKATKTFLIGGKSLTLTREDVVSAFGVKGGKEPIGRSKDRCTNSTFYKNFEGLGRLETSSLSRALREGVKHEGQEANCNVAQLITLYLLSAVFAPTKGGTFSWRYNKYLTDVKKINSYDWPKHIYDNLMESLVKKTAAKVIGCVVLIPYWIMDIFCIGEVRQENAKLLCERWDLRNLKALSSEGILTQLLESQGTHSNTLAVIETGKTDSHSEVSGSSNEGKEEDDGSDDSDSDGDDAVNLADDCDPWDDSIKTNKGNNNKVFGESKQQLVIQRKENIKLLGENYDLKTKLQVKDSQVKALNKRVANLVKGEKDWKKVESQFTEALKQKDFQLSTLNCQLGIVKNENAALRKQLNIKDSHVKVLEEANVKLVGDVTELGVQVVTQVAYAIRDNSVDNVLIILADDGIDDNKIMETNVKISEQSIGTSSKKNHEDSFVNSQNQHIDVAIRNKTPDTSSNKKPLSLNEKHALSTKSLMSTALTEQPLHVGSVVEHTGIKFPDFNILDEERDGKRSCAQNTAEKPYNLKVDNVDNTIVVAIPAKRTRKAPLKRDSWVYGSSASKTPEDLLDEIPIAQLQKRSLQIVDNTFDESPPPLVTLQPSLRLTNNYKRKRHAKHLSDGQIQKLVAPLWVNILMLSVSLNDQMLRLVWKMLKPY